MHFPIIIYIILDVFIYISLPGDTLICAQLYNQHKNKYYLCFIVLIRLPYAAVVIERFVAVIN